MCGICGVLHHDAARPVDRRLIEAINASIQHRGPDSDGFYQGPGVALAMRRLAIIDVRGGDQPIANETGEVRIVFNGEIYNAPELRAELEACGHKFQTRTDTEAILHLYEELGPACVDRLRGMFAFAIFDERRSGREGEAVLFLARDRFGKKPLYYATLPGGLIFGSELKCLLAHPGFSREIDPDAIHHYLTLQYVPDPMSAFRSAHKLPPGHWLIARRGHAEIETSIERFWQLRFEPKFTESEEELAGELRRKVREAVKVRLLSEVPLGAHLSGGLDSAIVVSQMAELCDEPVRTFSIGFGERAFDETPFARVVAEKFGAKHEEFYVSPDAVGLLPELARAFDEPFADPAAIPLWHLSQLTRRHVTVALNGDGGDELFAGYQRHYVDPWADLWRLLPRPIRERLIPAALSLLPRRPDLPIEKSPVAALRLLAQASSFTSAASIIRWSSYFMEGEKTALYTEEFADSIKSGKSAALVEEAFLRAAREGRVKGRLDRTLAADLEGYLPGVLLVKADRMTMSHSLEARSPLLDHELAKFAARLPERFKVRGTTTKWLLRRAFADILPQGIAYRGKQGFGVPLGLWFKGPLLNLAKETLLGSDRSTARFFKVEAVKRLIDENAAGQANHGKKLWTLLMLEWWMRERVLRP